MWSEDGQQGFGEGTKTSELVGSLLRVGADVKQLQVGLKAQRLKGSHKGLSSSIAGS